MACAALAWCHRSLLNSASMLPVRLRCLSLLAFDDKISVQLQHFDGS